MDMLITDSKAQLKLDAQRARRVELINDALHELRRASRIGGGVKPDNLEPENRAIMTGQTAARADSLNAAYARRRPNEYAIDRLVEMFRQDSPFAREAGWRQDAGETLLFATALQHTVSTYVPSLYAPNQAQTLFPIDTSLPAGATTVLKPRMIDDDDPNALGQLSPNADDVQLVEISATSDIYRLLSFARGIAWSLDELEEAAFGGRPLQTDKLSALDRAVARVFELVALEGVASGGISGAYNHAGITITAVVTGTWATPATALQIYGDVAALLQAIYLANDNEMPDRLVIPQSLSHFLNVRRANTDMSVRAMLLEDYPGLQIMECNRANLYDAAGTGPRIMAYKYNPEYLNIGVARPFTLEAPEKHGFSYRLIGRQKLAGCIASVPLMAGYMDGC